MASITINHVSKIYENGTQAVSDCSIEIRNGEFVVIVGPSGCGKSTLLRMVAGLEEITRGTISIDSQVVNDVPAKDRNISMVFQNYALFPHLNVFDNIAFGLKLRKEKKSEIKRKVENAAELLGIRHLLRQRLGQLSGGERQRVAMGRSIVRNPAVFLMDEPLSNLDAKLRTQMRAELIKLHQRLGSTFIYVTHDQTEAMTMGDRIVVMDKGVVQQIGTPEEIYNQPLNRFVASFVGSPPMNFIDTPDGSMGVRPEHIYFCTSDTPGAQQATVDLIEFLGADKLIYLSTESRRLIMRTSPDITVTLGEVKSITWNPEKALHF